MNLLKGENLKLGILLGGFLNEPAGRLLSVETVEAVTDTQSRGIAFLSTSTTGADKVLISLLYISPRVNAGEDLDIPLMEHQTVIEGSDSERTESIDLGTYEIQDQNCLAPGRLLWARMDQSPWWPVQIVDEKTISQNCIFNDRIKGGVLARFYGSCIYAWVDPFAHVSQFQGSFKEKGSNLRAFQKALEEEMLLRSKIVKSSVEPNGKSKYSETSSQHNKSGGDVNCISNVANVGKKIIFQSREEPAIKTSTRKRTKSEELEQSRSQGKQREKAPSNERDVTTGGSEKKLRRLKVMRHLGLAAPPDSPFNANSPVKIAA